VVADDRRLDAARGQCRRVLDQVDRACSRFRADSDLVRANREAGRWVSVSPLLAQATALAVQAAVDTAGLVDPTLGCHLSFLGYDRDLDEVRARPTPPAGDPTAIPLPVASDAWREVGVDPEGAVRVPPGVALDLGAIGKAFAADLIARQVSISIGVDLVISLGGDLAIGTVERPPAGGWPITIAERPDGEVAATVCLDRGGVATSTVLHRRWLHAGAIQHHLVDPRTGRPVERTWRTATVAGESCVEANTASTAAIVLGPDAVAWLTERDLAARLVGPDGRVVQVAGWPADAA
jgi:thiamine biosynthesis lipoprotein